MLDVWLTIAYLLAISLSLYTAGWLLMKADKNRTTAALAACQLLIIIWCIPQLFSALPMTRGMKYLAYGISYVGISFIGPAWLEFAFLYSRRRLRPWISLLLFGTGAVHYLALVTNEYHHLFYLEFQVSQVVYGPVFYVHMIVTYFCVLAGIGVVLMDFRKNQVALAPIIAILLAAAVPLGFNLLYITGWVRAGFDLTPPAFALSSVLMLLAVFRYDFLDVNTLAFDKIFASIAEGVTVFNKRGKITYCNEAAKGWLHMDQVEMAEELYGILKSHGFEQPAKEVGECAAAPVITLENGQRLEVKQYLHRDKEGHMVAGTLLFTDVGKYYELLEQSRELAVSNQRLAIEQERNRIAQEVHDTVGHTLTMIQSLMKLMEIEYEKASPEGAVIEEYLRQARRLTGDGIRQLRHSINDLKQETDCQLVSQSVYQLARSVKAFEVEVEIQGEDKDVYSYLSPVVYQCLREAVTNCLKYAGATHMDVILKFAGEHLNLYIFDNGRGCEHIEEGNGLKGIRERVDRAGGKVRILAGPGEGFQIYINLPLSAV